MTKHQKLTKTYKKIEYNLATINKQSKLRLLLTK